MMGWYPGWTLTGAWWMPLMLVGWAILVGLAVWGIARATRARPPAPTDRCCDNRHPMAQPREWWR